MTRTLGFSIGLALLSGTIVAQGDVVPVGPGAGWVEAVTGALEAGATVRLQAGRYELTEPIRLTPEHSGTIEAAPGAEAIVSGGVIIDGWEIDGDRWTVTLPEVASGDWHFAQLWANGERRYRPRWPEDGYSYIARSAPSTEEGQGHDRFRFDAGDIRADWQNLNDVEMLIFHSWSMSRIPLASVDEDQRVVTLAGRTWNSQIGALAPRKRYIAENVLEALNEPGEWYLDRGTGLLTYIPKPGETPDNTEIIVPRAEQLVSIVGDPEMGMAVSDITIRGITFEHANVTVPETGYCVAQAEVGARSTNGKSPFGSAIELSGTRDCVIEGCVVRHVGYYAVEFGVSCHENVLGFCEVWDGGGGGVKLGTANRYPEGDGRNAAGNVVEDCAMAHGGRMHPAAVGVWIGNSGDNQVIHNDIHDFYYTGVSVGWNWSWGYSPAKNNLVSHNHIYDIGQQRLSDLGGIYTLGESEGTVLSYNRIHDVSRVAYGGLGIYHDQATMGILSENNIVYRTQDSGFNVHWGKDNTVRNNIFAFGETSQINPGRTDLTGPITFERNLIVWDGGSVHRARGIRDDFASDRNLYWPGAADGEMTFDGDLSLDEWQDAGRDVNSIVADPGCADPANGDFTLKPNSPALDIGFEPIDASEIGRQAETRDVGDVPHAFPVAGPPPPKPIAEDFEFETVGAPAGGAKTFENNEAETARISDEQAASGKQSLKLMDGPGEPTFNPHVYYVPGFDDGMLRGAFDIMLEPGAMLSHEWRDRSAPYKVGASIRIDADGMLLAGQQELMQLPHGEWIHVEITRGMGVEATATFELSVTLPGEAPHVFEGLPSDPECTELHWLGWVAGAVAPVAIYIDNIMLAPAE